MRSAISLCLALSLVGPATAGPVLQLADEHLPLWEMRCQDRRVYVLTLEGTWDRSPEADASYYIQVHFPDGQAYVHRVLDTEALRGGEVRCLIQDYQLQRHRLAPGEAVKVVIFEKKASRAAPKAISNELEVPALLRRTISREPPVRLTPPSSPGDLPEDPPVEHPSRLPALPALPPGGPVKKPRTSPAPEKKESPSGVQGPKIEG
jgi:hypothetical protein